MESFLLKKDWPPGRQMTEAGKEEKPDPQNACQHPEGNNPSHWAQWLFIYRILWLLHILWLIISQESKLSGCLVPLICVAMDLCMIFLLPCCLAAKSCLTLATPRTVAHQTPLSMGFSRQEWASLVVFQARILAWVAIFFPRGSSQPRDQTDVSCIGRWTLPLSFPYPHANPTSMKDSDLIQRIVNLASDMNLVLKSPLSTFRNLKQKRIPNYETLLLFLVY